MTTKEDVQRQTHINGLIARLTTAEQSNRREANSAHARATKAEPGTLGQAMAQDEHARFLERAIDLSTTIQNIKLYM